MLLRKSSEGDEKEKISRGGNRNKSALGTHVHTGGKRTIKRCTKDGFSEKTAGSLRNAFKMIYLKALAPDL
ncbi:hypothetical protein TNCV_2558761 [Trichonephila clavipes]|nr:hypothetical protein TNCV_2558761 [Trichonephila clavipes]